MIDFWPDLPRFARNCKFLPPSSPLSPEPEKIGRNLKELRETTKTIIKTTIFEKILQNIR